MISLDSNARYKFNYDKILKVIQSLNPNKAHGHDDFSVKMLKLSCPPILKPFLIIFRSCLKFGTFPDDWRMGNIVPVHKKDNKQIVNNYRPVSLQPIRSKFLKSSFLMLYLNL